MRTELFDYDLPPELIAQQPLPERSDSRLLIVDRTSGRLEHKRILDLPDYLAAGDVLVINDTRVRPARLAARKPTGGAVEILLLQQLGDGSWEALVGGKRIRSGLQLRLLGKSGRDVGIGADVVAEGEGALRVLRFDAPVEELLPEFGETPLPPYIHEPLADPERYQTVYARREGSAAAPTAGLHFTPDLLHELRGRGVAIENLTLHIGLDTFKPVTTQRAEEHTIHCEQARLTASAARRVNEARLAGGRIWAVGTTVVRALETAALRSAGVHSGLQAISRQDAAGKETPYCPWRPVVAWEGATDLFIYPGYRFRAVDGLLTNFHLPRSTLLMLVSAFAGRELILEAYRAAIAERYRFYSFGDAMLIV